MNVVSKLKQVMGKERWRGESEVEERHWASKWTKIDTETEPVRRQEAKRAKRPRYHTL